MIGGRSLSWSNDLSSGNGRRRVPSTCQLQLRLLSLQRLGCIHGAGHRIRRCCARAVSLAALGSLICACISISALALTVSLPAASHHRVAWLLPVGSARRCPHEARRLDGGRLRASTQRAAQTTDAPDLINTTSSSSSSRSSSSNPVQQWWNDTVEFFEALEFDGGVPLDNDTAEEARNLSLHLKEMLATAEELSTVKKTASSGGRGGLWASRAESLSTRLGQQWGVVPGLTMAYYGMRFRRVFNRRVVKRGLANTVTYLQVIIVIVFLRVVAPRLLVAGSIDEVATSIGIPDKATLQAGLQELQAYGGGVVAALYLLAFVVEKLVLLSDILPIQIGLKTVSPVLFGGLVPGALMAATCETIAATGNFMIGRTFLTTRLRDFTLFDQRVSEAKWFNALARNAEEDGFRLVLLLRLAPVIPLPFDSYWYLLGALPVDILAFAAGHFVGCLKTCFLDASFGVLLLSVVVGVDGSGVAADADVQAQAQEVLLFEVIGFAVIAALVSTVATNIINEMLGLTEDEDDEEEREKEQEMMEKQQEGKDKPQEMDKPDLLADAQTLDSFVAAKGKLDDGEAAELSSSSSTPLAKEKPAPSPSPPPSTARRAD